MKLKKRILSGDAEKVWPLGFLHPNVDLSNSIRNMLTDLKSTRNELKKERTTRTVYNSVAYLLVAGLITFILSMAWEGLQRNFGDAFVLFVVISVMLWVAHSTVIMFSDNKIIRVLLLKNLGIPWLSDIMHVVWVAVTVFAVISITALSLLMTQYGNEVKKDHYVQDAKVVVDAFETYYADISAVEKTNKTEIVDFRSMIEREKVEEDKLRGGKGEYYKFYLMQDSSAVQLQRAYDQFHKDQADLKENFDASYDEFVKVVSSDSVNLPDVVDEKFRNLVFQAEQITFSKFPKFRYYLSQDYTLEELQTKFPDRASRLTNYISNQDDLFAQLSTADSSLIQLSNNNEFDYSFEETHADQSIWTYYSKYPSKFFYYIGLDSLVFILSYFLIMIRWIIFGSAKSKRAEELEQKLLKVFHEEEQNLPGEPYQLYLELLPIGYSPEEAGKVAQVLKNRAEFDKVATNNDKSEILDLIQTGKIKDVVFEVADLEVHQINELRRAGATDDMLKFANQKNRGTILRLLKKTNGPVIDDALGVYNEQHEEVFGAAFANPFIELQHLFSDIVDAPTLVSDDSYESFMEIVGRINSSEDIQKLAQNGFNKCKIILRFLKENLEVEDFRGLDLTVDNFDEFKKVPKNLLDAAKNSEHAWTADQLLALNRMKYIQTVDMIEEGYAFDQIQSYNSLLKNTTSLNGLAETVLGWPIADAIDRQKMLEDVEASVGGSSLEKNIMLIEAGYETSALIQFAQNTNLLKLVFDKFGIEELELRDETVLKLDHVKLRSLAGLEIDEVEMSNEVFESMLLALCQKESQCAFDEKTSKAIRIVSLLDMQANEQVFQNIISLNERQIDNIIQDAVRLRTELDELEENIETVSPVIEELIDMLGDYNTKLQQYNAKVKEAGKNSALESRLMKMAGELKEQYENQWEEMITRLGEIKTLFPDYSDIDLSTLETTEAIEQLINNFTGVSVSYAELAKQDREALHELMVKINKPTVTEKEENEPVNEEK